MIQIHRIPATIFGLLIAAVVLLCIVGCPAVTPAAEYSLPIKVGGETLSLDTEQFDWTTLAVLGGGGYGIWSWLKGGKDWSGSAKKMIDAAWSLLGKLPGDKKPVAFDGTLTVESGEQYTFHMDLGGKKPTPPIPTPAA